MENKIKYHNIKIKELENQINNIHKELITQEKFLNKLDEILNVTLTTSFFLFNKYTEIIGIENIKKDKELIQLLKLMGETYKILKNDE